MLVTIHTYQSKNAFSQAHQHLVVDEDPFTRKSQAELQLIIDNTLASLKKKRYISGGNGGSRSAAEALLRAAGSQNPAQVQVRWGLHQDEDMANRSGLDAKVLHFVLVEPNVGNEWPLYVEGGPKD